MAKQLTATTGQSLQKEEMTQRYPYFLMDKNPELGNQFDMKTGVMIPTTPYPPSVTIPNTTSIVWGGGKDPFSGKERNPGLHLIRYYVGCTTLFVDDQPKDKEVIDQFMRNPFNQIEFVHGRSDVYGYDTLKKMFMDWASYNIESEYRAERVKAFYKPYNEAKEKKSQGEYLRKQREAMNKAAEAPDDQVRFHAKYLGIPFIDHDTQSEREMEMIRLDYEARAMADPYYFCDTYGKEELQAKDLIQQALQSGAISATLIPGKAIWTKDQVEICLVEEGAEGDVLLGLLVNFATTKEGKGFLKMLKALYK